MIVCRVTGHRRYSADLPQGGVEISCTLTFHSNDVQLLDKTRKCLDKASSVWNEPQASPSAFIAAAQTCLVSSQPSQVTSQPSQVTPQPSQVTPQLSQVIPQPSQVTPPPSQVTSQPSQVTPQPKIDFQSIIMGEKLSDNKLDEESKHSILNYLPKDTKIKLVGIANEQIGSKDYGVFAYCTSLTFGYDPCKQICSGENETSFSHMFQEQ